MSVKIKNSWTLILVSVLLVLLIIYAFVLKEVGAKKAMHTEFTNAVSVVEKVLSSGAGIESLKTLDKGEGNISSLMFEGVLALSMVDDLTFEAAISSIGKIGNGAEGNTQDKGESEDLFIGGRSEEISGDLEELMPNSGNGELAGKNETVYMASAGISGGGIFAYSGGAAARVQVSDVVNQMSLNDLIKGNFALKSITCIDDYMEAVFLSERYCSKLVLVIDSGAFQIQYDDWR